MQIHVLRKIRSVKYYILLLSSVHKRTMLIYVILRIQILSNTCKRSIQFIAYLNINIFTSWACQGWFSFQKWAWPTQNFNILVYVLNVECRKGLLRSSNTNSIVHTFNLVNDKLVKQIYLELEKFCPLNLRRFIFSHFLYIHKVQDYIECVHTVILLNINIMGSVKECLVKRPS